jgi:hypothetical protein
MVLAITGLKHIKCIRNLERGLGLLMEGEGFMVGNNYLKRKYVINPNYVLHIYVLSSVKTSDLKSNKN